jgi:hypothetical protein
MYKREHKHSDDTRRLQVIEAQTTPGLSPGRRPHNGSAGTLPAKRSE